jgi:Anthrax toxin lethal factor, N- and C-terminal domain
MRARSPAIIVAALLVLPNSVIAGSARLQHPGAITVNAKATEHHPGRETYRGQFFDVSEVADRSDRSEVIDSLRHQIDVVQDLKLSPRVLKFFQTVPVLVDDFACQGYMTNPASGEPKPAMEAACYGRRVPSTIKTGIVASSIWGDEAAPQAMNSDPLQQTGTTGIVLIRPSTLVDQNKTRPILLHELLHAYHDRILPNGFANHAIQSWFKQASEQSIYPADHYLMSNEREFFAVTASVFLSGKDGSFVRADLKKKQPDYYTYLKWLFEFDPDAPGETPVALAN